MKHELPELHTLKELLREPKNIAWYKRVEFYGPKDSVEYLKSKILELNNTINLDENNTRLSGSL